MVELLHNRSHGGANEGMVVKPSGLRIHLTLDGNFDSECVAMDAGALVAGRDFGQTLRGFDDKIFGEANLHKRVVIDSRATLPSSISHRVEEFVLVMILSAWQLPRLPTTRRKIMAKAATEMESLKLHAKDTGSADVQIALLTQRILSLTEHLKVNAKDHSSRRGLLKLVATRRSLLDYLKRTAKARYSAVIEKLDLRK